jgi:hypothetical protein
LYALEGFLMDNVAGNFEQLPLARANMPVSLVGQYRIYTDHKNFTMVEAESAVGALEASGLQKAFKIEREALHKVSLIAPKFNVAIAAAEATAAPAV